MRRLTVRAAVAGIQGSRLGRLRGRDGERGGIAIALALLMPLVFMSAALAVDTAAVWSARQQVETGADAAALAVAMACAGGDCGDIQTTATNAFFANDKAAKVSDLGPGVATITVSGRSVDVTQTTPWVVNNFFAAAMGKGTEELTVRTDAAWAPTAAATAQVPLAVSLCTYTNALGGSLGSNSPTSLTLTTGSTDGCDAGTVLTTVGSGTCSTTSSWNGTVTAFPGSGLPSGCTTTYLSTLVGANVLIPVWDTTSGSADYHVYGYSAFHVTAVSTSSPPVVSGYFTYAAHQVDATTPPGTAAPDLGARSVFLTPTPTS